MENESAIYAGLKNTTGDYIAMMDADLQDPPELLLEMYEVLESGEHDCAGTRRMDRKGEPQFVHFLHIAFTS